MNEQATFDAAVLDGHDRQLAEVCNAAMERGLDGIPILLRLIVTGGA